MTSISFGSMFNPERVSINKGFNPERNIEGFAHGDAESPKDFVDDPKDAIGRSQVKTGAKKPLPHKLELTNEDKEALSKLTSSMYGFHGNSNDFWVHTKKPAQGQIPNLTMGDGKIAEGATRQDFVNKLVDSNTQAFQIAGNDELGGNKLITVVKNNKTNTTTMYTCDSKQCYPVTLEGDIDMEKLVSAITDNLISILGVTVWKE